MKRGLFVLAALLLAVAAAAGLSARAAQRSLSQPIAFDHKRHVAEDLACLDCHKGAETGPRATLPRIATCTLCHAEQKGESPEEPKVRAHVEHHEEIPWRIANQLPGHVYFSHAMHVKLGKMECAECHGNMAEATLPVAASQVETLTMRRCMACHAERGASNDCLACHK